MQLCPKNPRLCCPSVLPIPYKSSASFQNKASTDVGCKLLRMKKRERVVAEHTVLFPEEVSGLQNQNSGATEEENLHSFSCS